MKRHIAYLVKILPRAKRDLAHIYSFINAAESDAALHWYRGLKMQLLSLKETPNRNPVVPEDSKLRHLLYGKKPHIYRIIYRVNEKVKLVEVHTIRHGAMRKYDAGAL